MTFCILIPFQVTLPDFLKGRALHTTTIAHIDPTRKSLVNYGGVYEISRSDDPNTNVAVADTTIVEMGECYSCILILPHLTFEPSNQMGKVTLF